MADGDRAHELRMLAGQSMQESLDLFDDEMVEALEELSEPLSKLLCLLKGRDRSPRARAMFLVGMAIAAALDENP